MTLFRLKQLVIGVAMFAAAGLSVALTPTKKLSDEGPKLDLETMIPLKFGEWAGETAAMPLITPPDIKKTLETLYTQTLARTYVNAQGDRIMLSVAYGGDQGDSLQAHRPEVCYYAQGFTVGEPIVAKMQLSRSELPVAQLVAVQGARVEPITYWITVGDTAIAGQLQQKLAQLRYGLTGRIPDGILIRISNLSRDEKAAYRTHEEFIKAMLAGMNDKDRTRLMGARQL